MKIVLLIFGVLTAVMVYGAVAGPSINAGPVIDMDLTEEECRICHGDTDKLRNLDHSDQHSGIQSELDCYSINCHELQSPKKLDCMVQYCHANPADYLGEEPAPEESLDYTIGVTDHHDFTAIFSGDDWDCLICHEQGVPRPLDK